MQYLQSLINWLQLNPDYALGITFLMAFAESLIFVGGFIPGSIAITGIGVLAGSDIIPLYSTLFAAIIGAIVGDSASFLIGRIFKNNLRNFFIFRKYPRTLEYGEFYFEKHGRKSVFLARFIGPIRAIMPAIAGMLGMNKLDFIISNTLSAISWSALFFFPGVLIGRGHEQIQEHFQQIGLALLVLVIIPLIVIKLWRFLKLKFYFFFSQKLDKWWRLIVQISLLKKITPNRRICSYHSTATECLFLIFLILISFCITIHPITFPHYSWLEHPPLLNYLFKHTSHMNNWLHMVMLLSLFGLYCTMNQKFRWLASALILVACGFILNNWMLKGSVSPFPEYIISMNVFSMTLGLQYLWFRTLVRHKSHGSQTTILLLWISWCINAYLLSMHFKMPSLSFMFTGLVIGQIGWLHARFIDFYIEKGLLWFIFMFVELVVAWIK